MTISFYTGGARSGKSLSAEKRTLCYGSKAVYIATSEILDDEMAQRIENHIERRGSNWQTLEIPLDLTGAIHSLDGVKPVLIDCLTLWLSNHLLAKSDLNKEICNFADALEISKTDIVIVSNEVGSGIVPDNKLARQFQDAAGFMNQKVASVSDEVYFMVAGIETRIK